MKLFIPVLTAVFILGLYRPDKAESEWFVKDISPSSDQYYLSDDGDDAGPGTLKKPWKTLDKANKTLKAGDVLNIMEGSYPGIINPVNEGSDISSPIIYRGVNRYKCILTGQSGSEFIINLKNQKYITIECLSLLPEKNGFGIIEDCDYITVDNCRLYGSTGIYRPLFFNRCNYIRLTNNDISKVISRTADSKIHGDACHVFSCTHTLIEGNSFSMSGHCPLGTGSYGDKKAEYNIIRGNIFHCIWGRNFGIANEYRLLFEENIITSSYNGASSADAAAQLFMTDGIFRFNHIYENFDFPLASMCYKSGSTNKDLELSECRFYYNTFKDNPTRAWDIGSFLPPDRVPVRSNIFINNLFINNGSKCDNEQFRIFKPGVGEDNKLINNRFYSAPDARAKLIFFGEKLSVEEANSRYASQCIQNTDTDIDKTGIDSNGINGTAGYSYEPLTFTSGGGKGKVIHVNDARYFFDGFGIEGEKGDLIVLGGEITPVQIEKVDISANTITVNREVSWTDKQPVNIVYKAIYKSIPELHKIYNDKIKVVPLASRYSAEPGQNIDFSCKVINAKGRYRLRWDMNDGSTSESQKHSYTYKEPGEYAVRVKCIDSSGETASGIILVKVVRKPGQQEPLIYTDFEEDRFEEWGHQWDRGPSRQGNYYFPEKGAEGKGQCMAVSAKNGNKMLSVSLKLKSWNIDYYPHLTFAYKIPAGVPVGVWLSPWISVGRPLRICIGGTSANSHGKLPVADSYNLIDDGEWHNIEIDVRKVRKIIPGINDIYAFEFYTYAEASEDQKFWFDDFMIKP